MYKVDFIVDFICILRIIWWSKSSRVERGIYLTFTICPNLQFFFHNTIYYWFISNGSGSDFPPTIIYWFIFFTRTIVRTLVISVVFLFIFPLNSFVCSSIEVLLCFYYFFLDLFICFYSSNLGVYYHDFVFSVWFRYASPLVTGFEDFAKQNEKHEYELVQYKQYKKFINKKLSTEDTNMDDVILISIFLSLNISFMSIYQELSLEQSLSLPMHVVL